MGLRMSKLRFIYIYIYILYNIYIYIFIPGIFFFPTFRISAGFGISEFRKEDVSICNILLTVGKFQKRSAQYGHGMDQI